ncbi:MAG: hypothetical protein IJ681_07750 [Bacteroidales bacterium]|nr:hypothetical protein [Bacteroidales bacterium]
MEKFIVILIFFSLMSISFCQTSILIQNKSDVYDEMTFLPELTTNSDTIYTEFTDFVLTIKFNYKLPCDNLKISYNGYSISRMDSSFPASLYNIDILYKKSVSFNETDSISDTNLFNTHYLLVPNNFHFDETETASILIKQGLSHFYITMLKVIDKDYIYMKRDKYYVGYKDDISDIEDFQIETYIERCIQDDNNTPE